MNTDEKNQQIVDLCKKLKYEYKIVFSDEGNLKSHTDVKKDPQWQYFPSRKPHGLWYSFGPSWVSYLTGEYKDHGESWERKRLACMTHIYRLSLDESKIYCIENEKHFDKFTKNFALKKKSVIDWEKVAEGWSGVEIRYISNREDVEWYIGWDCSSGCIWNPDAVKRIRLLASWEPTWSYNDNTCPF